MTDEHGPGAFRNISIFIVTSRKPLPAWTQLRMFFVDPASELRQFVPLNMTAPCLIITTSQSDSSEYRPADLPPYKHTQAIIHHR